MLEGDFFDHRVYTFHNDRENNVCFRIYMKGQIPETSVHDENVQGDC